MRVRDIEEKYNKADLRDWPHFNKKDFRKRRIYRYTKHLQYIKKMIHEHQQEFNGIDIRNLIPKNTPYCYIPISKVEYKEDGTPIYKIKNCPFWYSIEIEGAINKEDGEAENAVWDQHPGLVAVGQHWIGGCKLIKKTDDDMGGFGLLWDSCKECSINES